MDAIAQEHYKPVIPMSLNKKVFRDSRGLSQVYQNMVDLIERYAWDGLGLPPTERRLVLFVFYAAINSGIGRPEVLVNLVNKLVSEKMPLHCSVNRIHIDVNKILSGLAGNSNDGEQRTSLFLCYLDFTALAAAHGLLRSCLSNVVRVWDEAQLLESINQLIEFANGKRFTSLSAFCKAAVALAFRLPGVNLPIFLKNYADGSMPSHAMPLYCLDAFEKKRTRPEFFIKPLGRVTRQKYALTRAKSSITASYYRLPNFYRRLLRCCEIKKARNNKSNVELVIGHLNSLLTGKEELAYPEEIFVSWLLEGLNSKSWKSASTPRKYVQLIGKDWLRVTREVDLANADGAELDAICDAILSERDHYGNKEGRLRDLIIFGIQHCELNAPDNPFFSVSDVSGYVRSIVIPEHISRQVRHDLRASTANQGHHIQLTLDALFLVMTRTFLRPSEIIRLKVGDVELSPEGWLFIRGAKLKTLSSKRKIPSGFLFLAEEKDEFVRFVKLRKSQTEGGKNALLFSKGVVSDEKFSVEDLEESIGQLVSNYMGAPVPVYQYRHTGMTNLAIVTFGSDYLIEQMTPYDDEQAAKMRQSIHGNRLRDRLWQIASFAGHVTPKTTNFSYIHVLDLLLCERLSNADQARSASYWRNLSQLSSDKIRALQEQKVESDSSYSILKASTVKLCANDLGSLLQKQLQRFIQNSAICDTRKFADAAPESISIKADMFSCFEVLSLFDRLKLQKNESDEKTVVGICLEKPWDERTVAAWVSAAKTCAMRYTTKARPRLTKNKDTLCPTMPRSGLEEHDANQLLIAFRGAFKKNSTEIKWCMEYLLNHVRANDSFISFTQPEDFQRFVKGCADFIQADRWSLSLILGNEKLNQKRLWQSSKVRHYSVETSKYKSTMLGRLYYLHPDKTKLEKHTTFGTNSLKYVFTMAAIMLIAQRIMSTSRQSKTR